MDLRPTKKRVRAKDQQKASARPLDGSPSRRQEREGSGAAALAEEDDRSRTKAEAKGAEERDAQSDDIDPIVASAHDDL